MHVGGYFWLSKVSNQKLFSRWRTEHFFFIRALPSLRIDLAGPLEDDPTDICAQQLQKCPWEDGETSEETQQHVDQRALSCEFSPCMLLQ